MPDASKSTMISKMAVPPAEEHPRAAVLLRVREVLTKHIISGRMTARRWAEKCFLRAHVIFHAVQIMIVKSISVQASVLAESIIVNLIPVITSQDGMMYTEDYSLHGV